MKRIIALVLCLIMVCSIVACGAKSAEDSKTTTPTVTDAPKAEATEAPKAEVTEAPKEEASREGGTLVVAVSAESDSMLVTKVRSSVINMWPIFEGLFKFDSTGAAVPYLVKTYEEDVEKLTYTLHLQEGVKFHDGSELTAEVVKWNLENYQANGILPSFLASIETIEVVDTYTVVLHLSAWDSLLPSALARQMGYMASKEAYDKNGEEWLAANPVGTGPFKFVSWEQGVKMTYARFDEYWQGKPYLDGVEFVVYTTDLVTQASMQAKEVHVWQAKDYNIARQMEAEGFTVVSSNIPQVVYNLYYECMNESDPFSDLRVRQAATYAINAQEISDKLLNGFGILTNQFATPGSPYFSQDVVGYPYNPEKAKELLAEAGYADGFETTMVVWNSPAYVNAAQVMQQQLAEVGIKVEFNLVDLAGFVVLMDGWNNGMFFHPMGISNGPAPQIAGMFVKGLESGGGAHSLLHPDDVDALIQTAKSGLLEDSYKNFQDAAKLIWEDYCMLKTFVAVPSVTVVSPDVADCGIGVDSSFTGDLSKTYFITK